MTDAASANNPDGTPRFRSGKQSRRFLRNLVWVVAICLLFLGGQGVRYYLGWSQLSAIQTETENLYRSVLGPDIGGSPFGRLQFEHGKLMAASRIGLDTLSVLDVLSSPAGQGLRLESLSLNGLSGRARGVFEGNMAKLEDYLRKLSDDDHYIFTAYKNEELPNGVLFNLRVEPR